MAGECVMQKLAGRFAVHCPAEVCEVECPMPTQECIDYAGDDGLLTPCWEAVGKLRADAGEVRLRELLLGWTHLRRAGSVNAETVGAELARAIDETGTPGAADAPDRR